MAMQDDEELPTDTPLTPDAATAEALIGNAGLQGPPMPDQSAPAAPPPVAPPAAPQIAAPAPSAPAPTASLLSAYGISPPPSAEQVFGPMQGGINDYKQHQAQVYAGLQNLLAQYQQASRPNNFDALDDAWYKFASAKAAAAAGAHTTAGSVVYNQRPDAGPFLSALKAGHDTDLQERNLRIQQLRDMLSQGTALQLGQLQGEGTTLGMEQSLAGQKASYGVNTAQFGVKLAQLNQDAYKVGLETVNQIKNPDAAGQFVTAFTDAASKSGPMSAQGYTALAGKVLSGLRAGGVNLNAPTTDLMLAEHINSDRTVSKETIDPGTPQGQARIKSLAANGYTFTKIGSPQTNISVNNAPGGGEGAKASDYVSEIQGGQRLAGTAGDALKLLPLIKANGGSGVLTDSGIAKDVANEIARSIGADPSKISVRATYDKLVNQAAADQIISTFKGNGNLRGVQEFKFIGSGQVDPTMPIATQEALLNHYQHIGQWSAAHGTSMIGQANAPDVLNRTRQYSEPAANADWLNSHPFPSTPTDALIKSAQAPVAPPAGSGPQTRQPGGGSPRIIQRKAIGGQSYYQASDGNWYPDTGAQ